jgi:hypothetical protein
MSTLKADIVTASSTNGNLAISNQGTGGIAIDGMPHRNLIINGNMRIAARGTSFAGPGNVYTLDRYVWVKVGVNVVTITQDTDTPTVAEAGVDFVNSLKIDCTTVDASVASGDLAAITQKIEGLNWAHLGYGATGAATVTISFWVKSTKTGIFTVSLRNGAYNRSYPAEYTVSSADTWEKKSVTITGDTTGTWLTTNGIGAWVTWALMSGSDYTGTANQWNGANDIASTNQVNSLDNTANNFFLTGVQLEAGAQSSDFEHIDIASQKAMCKRYYDKVTGNGSDWVVGFVRSTTTGSYIYQYAVEMRSAPTIAFQSVTDCDVRHAATSTVCSGLGASGKTTKHCSIDATVGSGLTVGHGSYLRWNDADGYVTFDSEL